MRFFLLFLLAPMAAVALDLTEQQRADIEARIQPFSAVCVRGETCGGGEAMADAAGRSGEDVTTAPAWHATRQGSQERQKSVTKSHGQIASPKVWTHCMTVA